MPGIYRVVYRAFTASNRNADRETVIKRDKTVAATSIESAGATIGGRVIGSLIAQEPFEQTDIEPRKRKHKNARCVSVEVVSIECVGAVDYIAKAEGAIAAPAEAKVRKRRRKTEETPLLEDGGQGV